MALTTRLTGVPAGMLAARRRDSNLKESGNTTYQQLIIIYIEMRVFLTDTGIQF